MSEHAFERSKVNGSWNINNPFRMDKEGRPIPLSKEVKAALPGRAFALSCTGALATFTFEEVLTAQEIADLNDTVSAHQAPVGISLAVQKLTRIASVDSRTDSLIALGFAFEGEGFSLSSHAQEKMMGLHQIRDDPSVVYPVVWNSIDNLDTIPLANSDAVHAMYLQAVGTVRAHLDSGTVLKQSITAAITQAALDSVIDNR